MGKHSKKRNAPYRAGEETGDGEGKRHKQDGEYPPPHVLTSGPFETYYRECGIVGEEEWDAFITTLRDPLGVSFRITGHPDDPASVSLRDYMERQHLSLLSGLELDGQPVPPPYPITWYGNRMAWRFDVSRNVLRGKGAMKNDDSLASRTLAAFHNFLMAETELGTISRQEEVSMVPPCLLDVQPGQTVADLCAAPGSKTQQLIEAINPPARTTAAAHLGPRGLVIANDMDYKRCHLLVHQAKRLNSPALIVTNHDATMLPTKMVNSLKDGSVVQHTKPAEGWTETKAEFVDSKAERSLRFDRILCDVPCSGDGTLRKAPDLWRRWTDGLGIGVHRMQLNILTRGLQMLVPGGKLVYSTCSMNPIEDEAVVASALLELGTSGYSLLDVSTQLPELKRRPGVASWKVHADGVWYGKFDDVAEETRAARKLMPTMFAPPAETAEALHLERCMRVLPHFQNTGGFFIAVLQRAPTAQPVAAAASAASKAAAPVSALAAPPALASSASSSS